MELEFSISLDKDNIINMVIDEAFKQKLALKRRTCWEICAHQNGSMCKDCALGVMCRHNYLPKMFVIFVKTVGYFQNKNFVRYQYERRTCKCLIPKARARCSQRFWNWKQVACMRRYRQCLEHDKKRNGENEDGGKFCFWCRWKQAWRSLDSLILKWLMGFTTCGLMFIHFNWQYVMFCEME